MTDDPQDPSRLDDLDARLRAARARSPVETEGPSRGGNAGTGMGLGFRIAVELVAGIAVGTLMGYGLDGWLGTRPMFIARPRVWTTRSVWGKPPGGAMRI